jgi:hypothetical protein
LHSLSSMLDGRWKQGRRMTSWFDVSAHDLHGVHKSPSEVSNNRTTHRPECDEFQYLLKQVMIFDGMAQIRAVQLHPMFNCDGNSQAATQHGYIPLLYLHCLAMHEDQYTLTRIFRWNKKYIKSFRKQWLVHFVHGLSIDR